MGEGMTLAETAELRLAEREGGGSILAVTPVGDEIAPEQRSVFGTRRVSIEGAAMAEPGFARLIDADTRDLRHLLAVNLDPAESDPRLLGGSEVATMVQEAYDIPARVVEVEGDVTAFARTLRDARRGVEIWNVFLLLALGFLVAEMLVAKRWKPETAPA